MRSAFRPPQPVVWINGWPAVGKQAVAQCLSQMLGQERAVVIDDREFTDQLNLPLDALMARYSSSRNRHGGGNSNGNGNGSGSRPRGRSLGGQSQNHNQSQNQSQDDDDGDGECPGRQDPGDQLITAQEGMSALLREKQEACFRKYVQDREAMQRIVIFTDCRANDAGGAEGARRYADAARQAGRPFVPIYVECQPNEHERRSQSSDRRYSQADGGTVSGAEAARELQALAGGCLYTFPQNEVPGLFVNVTEQGTHDSAVEIISFINAVCEKRSDSVAEAAAVAARRRPSCSNDSTPD